MKERVYKTDISDIRVEAIFFDEAFYMKKSGNADGIMPRITQLHRHSTYEIFFVPDGTLTVNCASGSDAFSSSAIIIPPKYDHFCTYEINKGYCFYFTLTRLDKRNGSMFSSICETVSKNITSLKISEAALFYVMQFAKSTDESTSDEKISHILYLLFSELFEALVPCPDNSKASSNKYIHIIEAFITNYASGSVTLSKLAEKLYLCPKQVSRIIKKEYGCSLSELVNRQRLTVACSLLKHTDLSVSQIASSIGYEYENYFFSLFKKTYGITPLQYRKINKF